MFGQQNSNLMVRKGSKQRYPTTMPARWPTKETLGTSDITSSIAQGKSAVGTLNRPRTLCLDSEELHASTTMIEKMMPDSPALFVLFSRFVAISTRAKRKEKRREGFGCGQTRRSWSGP